MSETPINDSELTRLEALCNAATSGPWKVIGSRDVFEAVVAPGRDTICTDCENAGDADFISASRTALPLLIEEVRRLRESLTSAVDHSAEGWRQAALMSDEIDRIKAALAGKEREMSDNHRYWKADAKTSAEIIALMKGWADTVRRGNALAKEHGAKAAYTGSNGWSGYGVVGFAFDDESKVDKKLFCRLKNTSDGWRPRSNSQLAKEFEGMRSFHPANICKLIGMVRFGKDGLRWHTPGVSIVGKVAYLITPDYVNAKGCERISDIQYEKATKPKRAKAG